jgi:hypothetical protein
VSAVILAEQPGRPLRERVNGVPPADADRPAPPDAATVDAALRKVAVVWLAADGRPAAPVWALWHERTLYVVHGGGEQAATGLAGARAVTVSVAAKGTRELLVEFPAEPRDVAPGSDEWHRVVALLLPKRLNLHDPATAPERWARESTVTAIAPRT